MQTNKLLIAIMIILTCMPLSIAYSEEGGLEGDESYSIEYTEGHDYYEWKDPQHPNWYDPIVKLIIKIIAFFTTDETITVTHNVSKESWNGAAYESTGDESSFSWDLTHDANQTATTITTLDPVEEFFRDDRERIDEFDTSEDHPDILNISTTIDADGTELDSDDYGYTTVSEENLKEIEKEIGGDYGFDLNSIGGEGGSGLIAGKVGWGAQDETSIELGKVFGIIFFAFLPFLFIMFWIKMSNKVMK